MKLTDLEATKVGSLLQYSVRPRDDQGDDHHLFTATGPRSLLQRVLKDVEIDISIQPKASEHEANASMAELAKKANQGLAELATAPFAARPKHAPARPTQANSVYLTLRRLEGHGTLWIVALAPLFIPTGANLFLWFPPVSYTSGSVFPASGDTDLFLWHCHVAERGTPGTASRKSSSDRRTPDAHRRGAEAAVHRR